MRIKVIGCKVLMRQLYALAAASKNTVDILWMKQELHTEPDKMRLALQRAIDRVEQEEAPYDAIVLGYGLCSNGVVGLRARTAPLVMVRAHDCITMLLGSKQRYARLFEEGNGGIYWYSQGWIENADMPSRERYEKIYAQYLAKYGEDNAQYLMEMEQSWMREYQKAVYIRWPGEGDEGDAFTRESARYHGWAYQAEEGEQGLLRDLLDGPWDDPRFLMAPPGTSIAASHDDGILAAAPMKERIGNNL